MLPRHMDTLLAIVDEGSFEAAAATLGVSASAISQRMKTLEAAVGRVLLRRTVPVSVTPAGEVLVQTARRMQLLEAEADSLLSGSLATVPLSIVINADSLATWFRPVFASAQEFMGPGLRLRIEDERHSLRLLQRGDCMGAVTTEEQPVTGCHSEFLGYQRYLAVASPTVAALIEDGTFGWSNLPYVRYNKKDSLEVEYLRQHQGDIRVASERRETHVPYFDGINDAVAAGLGWAMVPEKAATPYINSGQFVVLDGRLPTTKNHPNWLDVPLYWQRWKVESELLEKLTDAIHAAAARTLLS
ncbi:ArgP/LysG family DNA-binding transcriptional regulator [Corynebacterium sp. 4HC-13]|uniref:ArgP/LysG family DNA-binding transcriptional regulator n=1 Tax=Corynebacterium anserum TaxID=2684406 RepID=UPI001639CC06|nr:ArgP/LysG family DNA-binding transcriptional regulator [Corynebacterium anserum]MBC2681845.1 ArgP/LysG family DNA-binding transcriptional regulator [Corynebacterium anserum]